MDKIRVNSREYSSPIQTATYPPFTKGTPIPCKFVKMWPSNWTSAGYVLYRAQNFENLVFHSFGSTACHTPYTGPLDYTLEACLMYINEILFPFEGSPASTGQTANFCIT